MARRLARTATRLGIEPTGLDLIRRAFEIGMGPRFARGLEDHHPDYLHPSRTALILMDDARVADATVLATALVTETRDPMLRPPPDELEALDRVVRLLASVPDPEEEGLAERLVSASMDARLVAVAERLDHARHLHLRDRQEWAGYHAVTCGTFAPVADRTHPALAGRITWWCTTFEERFLGS